MGYTHGIMWTNDLIEKELKKIIKENNLDFFPSQCNLTVLYGDSSLANAVKRHGGVKFWREKLGLNPKKNDSLFGNEYELKCISYITQNLNLECEKTKARYPYDICVEGNIKIDVKASNLYNNGPEYYTFNLENKIHPTCDIFVCFCIKQEKIEKIYLIPSCVLQGKTQLSIGVKKSKYDKYIDNWGLIKKYYDFYEQLKDC